MILLEWLETRTPAPPPRLFQRIVEVLGSEAGVEVSSTILVGAAERLLRQLTTQRTLARDSALDLLTVDALVTYAFEYAATSPDTLRHTTTMAMERLGSIVA